MFHKRDDRLQRLNEELLAEEEDYFEEYEEDEDLDEADIAELLGEEEPEEELFYRNHSNGYGADIRNYANRYGKGSPLEFDTDDMEEEDLEDEEFLYRDDYRQAKKQQKKAKRAAKKERKGKLGLAVLAFIELVAILGILAWWASWIL